VLSQYSSWINNTFVDRRQSFLAKRKRWPNSQPALSQDANQGQNQEPSAKKQMVRCDHCKKLGHTRDRCWILNPSLKTNKENSKYLASFLSTLVKSRKPVIFKEAERESSILTSDN
jgi:hypothetical protein